MGATGVIVAMSIMAESNVTKVGEIGVVVATSKKVAATSVATVRVVAKVVTMGAMGIVVVATSKKVVAKGIVSDTNLAKVMEIDTMSIVVAASNEVAATVAATDI
eukprot:1930554-Ditylum_brightwellii.AAC.1